MKNDQWKQEMIKDLPTRFALIIAYRFSKHDISISPLTINRVAQMKEKNPVVLEKGIIPFYSEWNKKKEYINQIPPKFNTILYQKLKAKGIKCSTRQVRYILAGENNALDWEVIKVAFEIMGEYDAQLEKLSSLNIATS